MMMDKQIKQRQFTRRSTVLLPIGALALITGCGDNTPRPSVDDARATVVTVVDGSTFVADIQGKRQVVRLAGCLTPRPDPKPGMQHCGFEESRQHLLDAVSGKALILTENTNMKVDQHRLVRHVWTENPQSLVNREMIRDGMAGYDEAKIDKSFGDLYRSAAESAGKSKVGMLNECGKFDKLVTRFGSPRKPAKILDEIQVKGLRMTVQEVSTRSDDNKGRLAEAGHKYALVDLRFEVVRETNRPSLSKNGFSLYQPDMDETFHLAEIFLKDYLEFGELELDSKRTGIVGFSVPDNLNRFILTYQVDAEHKLCVRFEID